MFDNLSEKITKVFNRISGKKFIGEDDLNNAIREIRIALIEADVALQTVKNFIEKIKQEALGKEVIKSVSPAQMIIKIVHDEMVNLLGSDKSDLNLNNNPPLVILMVGLQGAGKTTTSAKIASRLNKKYRKKVLLASLDTYRPAAADQLKILSQKISTDFCNFDLQKTPQELAKLAKKQAVDFGYDILILDSAGRISIDDKMMQELLEVKSITNPQETILVVDSMIGQDSVNVAKNFHEKINLTGIVLTRMDGDARGGAALTMKDITQCPIKFIGTGEKIEDIEEFDPKRIASRIFGMGDVVSLVEKAQELFNEEEIKKAEKKMRSGKFDFEDLLSQMRNMKKMGGISSIMNFLPGVSQIKDQLSNPKIEKEIKMQEAMILSMTKKERQNPDILNSSRKNRIAKGAGTTIQEVNRLMKKYKQMQKMMKKIGKIDPQEMKKIMSQDPSLSNIF